MSELIPPVVLLGILYLFASVIHGSFNVMAWEDIDRLFFALGCFLSLIMYGANKKEKGKE